MKNFFYKIVTKREWSDFKKKNFFYGTRKDLRDKYIHLSKKNQIKKTLQKHYLKKKNLVLLKIKIPQNKRIIWEKSSNGEVFPHLYYYLDLSNVENTYKIFLKKNGSHFILSKY